MTTDKKVIIYHDQCNDGFAAAWTARAYFGEHNCEFVPARYNRPAPEYIMRDIFILDFSYPRAELEKMKETNNAVFVLDHHKTAAMDLALLPPVIPVDAYRETRAKQPAYSFPLMASFDMARSGAGMAWDWFFPMFARPSLIDYVEDRDLWRFADPDTRFVHSALSAYDYDFDQWDELARRVAVPEKLVELIGEGQTLDRKHLKLCREIIEQARRMAPIGGVLVPVCAAPYAFASDIGNMMCKGHPFAATYVEHANGITFSLRSSPEGDDASVIAKLFGGGGHRNACGFTIPRSPDGGVTWPA